MSGATLKTVYFMRQIGTKGPVKIGCSGYLPGRLDSLSVWSPVPLEVVASFPGTIVDEMRVHYRFREHLSHHEWFHWSPDLEALMDEVRAGTFDIENLPPRPKGATIGGKMRTPWTPEARKMASISHRVRWMEKRHGRFLPYPLSSYPKTEEEISKVEAVLLDPIALGQTAEERWPERCRSTAA